MLAMCIHPSRKYVSSTKGADGTIVPPLLSIIAIIREYTYGSRRIMAQWEKSFQQWEKSFHQNPIPPVNFTASKTLIHEPFIPITSYYFRGFQSQLSSTEWNASVIPRFLQLHHAPCVSRVTVHSPLYCSWISRCAISYLSNSFNFRYIYIYIYIRCI